MKRCSKCLKLKQKEDFSKRSDGKSKDGLESLCKKCKQLSKRKWYHKTKTNIASRFKVAQDSAKRRNLKFNINYEIYEKLISLPCDYCKSDIYNEMGVGLDRLDNNKGYTTSNVVPCCGNCNLGRTNRYTHEEWKVMVQALMKYRAAVAE